MCLAIDLVLEKLANKEEVDLSELFLCYEEQFFEEEEDNG
jgi:hypothetical protein